MKQFLKNFLTIFLFVFFFSCSKTNEETTNLNVSIQEDQFYLNEENALMIASELTFPQKRNLIGKSDSSKKTIKERRAIPDDNKINAYYIINYNEGGFVIVSADKRVQPILAYSEDLNFNLEKNQIPGGLLNWLKETALSIGEIRKNNTNKKLEDFATVSLYSDSSEYQKLINSSISNVARPSDTNDPNECFDQSWYYGPLINSEWNQGNGFNNLLANYGCNSIGGRPPAGCVATAIGQVMRFYQKPTNYNWSNMPLNQYGSNEISLLLKDIGTAVNMNYDCDGSGADTSDGVSALKNTFGYSSASFGSWNHSTTKNEIVNGRPVILAGSATYSCFLWWCKSTGGHAWVVEGYKSHFYCSTGTQHTYYYMNWGWGGSYNGYYAYNDWSPSSYDFNQNKRMMYNIKP